MNKANDPRYVPGFSQVDDDMTEQEWVDAMGEIGDNVREVNVITAGESVLWTPINDYPGDQRYDNIPPTADLSYWGQIGADGDHGWHWCIVAQNDDGDTWEIAGGTAEDEGHAKQTVETWTP